MKLSEVLLEGLGINPKTVRPASILDVIDGLLLLNDNEHQVKMIKELTGTEFTGSISNLSTISSMPALVKLMAYPKSAKLYTKLLVNIMTNTSVELSKEAVLECLGNINNQNAQYKALNKALDDINNVLENKIILHMQYADKVRFIILTGTTDVEYLKSLQDSGYQSPNMLDKLHGIFLTKGLYE